MSHLCCYAASTSSDSKDRAIMLKQSLFPFAAAALLLGGLMSLSVAWAQGEVKQVHGGWEIRCETPTGAQAEQCAMIQFVVADDRPNVGLTVILLRTADKKAHVLRVLAPLGVLLPSGLGLRVDEANLGSAPFVRCLPDGGCVSEIVMDDKLVGQLKKGKTATFVIFQTPEEGIGIPIALNGFTAAFDALDKL
ncbi:MAG: invasion associated locus B family protein [Rhizobiales bacterium]|nr:invasion associated locus B family protein [Hyphomicrobiales bacterium]